MKKEKLYYEAPTSETLELRFEGMICGSPDNEDMNNTSMSGGWVVNP